MRTNSRIQTVAYISLILLLLAAPRPIQATGSAGATPASAPTVEPPNSPRPVPPDPEVVTQRLIELINETRWENGHVPPLKANLPLRRAAEAHSQSMALNDFFGHKGVDNSSPWDRIEAAGYGNWYLLAENIAAGYADPEEVLQAWMDSPRHRENLLNPDIQEAGLGYFFEADDTHPGITWGYEHYWTLDMGTRWDAYPLVIAREAYSTSTPVVSLYLYGQGWAVDVRLSNNGVDWTDWQPYRPTLTWELTPGNGAKRVYVQLRDAQGDLMQSEDGIILEGGPAPPGSSPSLLVNLAEAVFVMEQGKRASLPGRYRVQITDSAGEARTWDASWDQNWIYFSARSGTTPSEVVLTLNNRVYFLSPGVHTATLTIRGEDMQTEIPIRLFVFRQVYSVYLPNVVCHSLP